VVVTSTRLGGGDFELAACNRRATATAPVPGDIRRRVIPLPDGDDDDGADVDTPLCDITVDDDDITLDDGTGDGVRGLGDTVADDDADDEPDVGNIIVTPLADVAAVNPPINVIDILVDDVSINANVPDVDCAGDSAIGDIGGLLYNNTGPFIDDTNGNGIGVIDVELSDDNDRNGPVGVVREDGCCHGNGEPLPSANPNGDGDGGVCGKLLLLLLPPLSKLLDEPARFDIARPVAAARMASTCDVVNSTDVLRDPSPI
jgi:hypothetical protein